MAQIKKFGVGQTAKVIAILYLIPTAIIMIPAGLIMLLFGGDDALGGGIMFMLSPILYGLVSYVAIAIGCLIYNFVASKVGGIEIEIQ